MKNNREIIKLKKNIPLLLTLLLFYMDADVHAQEWWTQDSCVVDEKNFYVKISTGANFLQNITIDRNKSTYQTGYLISSYLGYCWHYGIRIEGEYAYRRNALRKIHFFGEESSKHGHFQTSSWMANLLWDLPLSSWGCAFWNIQPFIGAGVGYDVQRMHASNPRIVFNQRWNRFSWQLMTGLNYPIFCNTDLSLEYKFHQGSCHFYNHSVGFGVRVKFGLW